MNYQEQIDEIMDYVNFNRIHTAMTALNWTWAPSNGVPEVPELRQQARYYLNLLVTEDLSYAGSGGFTARKDSDGYLSLTFELEYWDTNPDMV